MSARTLQCLFEGVCMLQYFRTLTGLDQGWTHCPNLNEVVGVGRGALPSLDFEIIRNKGCFFNFEG